MISGTSGVAGLFLAGALMSSISVGFFDDVMNQFNLVEKLAEQGFAEAARVVPQAQDGLLGNLNNLP